MGQRTVVLAAVLSSAAAASAGPFELYGSHTTGSVQTWGLVQFDTNPVNGKGHTIGAGGLMFDFDFGPDGVLYSPRGSQGLYKVNTQTGTQTLIGSWGADIIMAAVAFDPEGSLYGADLDGMFYAINKATGKATPIIACGEYVFGMDFGPDGTLYYGSGDIFAFDLETGVSTVVVPWDDIPFAELDYGADGVFRAVSFENGGDGLYSIDLEMGSATSLGKTFLAEVDALASIPAPFSATVLAAVPLVGHRRRRRTWR